MNRSSCKEISAVGNTVAAVVATAAGVATVLGFAERHGMSEWLTGRRRAHDDANRAYVAQRMATPAVGVVTTTPPLHPQPVASSSGAQAQPTTASAAAAASSAAAATPTATPTATAASLRHRRPVARVNYKC
ncbi:hypothetical protein F503_04533 [Ophiostoma piceae UAMH 11346]|uniref:Uncharacterized protein n=1 Tax=Ophiostoma piceae (strain UAMH 11346) TaxID=1262450 RepID=S3CAJ6_OPHP1|nr:hypothetical protein F503_04533 [Ophiostoma piceae UAMH 11346]